MAEEKVYTCCILDTETGGLDPKKCAITQLSCKVIRMDTYEIIGVFDEYIKPYDKIIWNTGTQKKVLRTKREVEQECQGTFDYNQRALDVTGLSLDVLNKKGKSIFEVADSFIEFIKKCTMGNVRSYRPVFVGQNPLFDWGYLQHLFTYTGQIKELNSLFLGDEDFYGNFIPLLFDTLTLARMVFSNNSSVTTYKLENLCNLLKIELVDAHSSMADVDATCDIFTVFVNRMRTGENEDTSTFLKTAEKYRTHFKI